MPTLTVGGDSGFLRESFNMEIINLPLVNKIWAYSKIFILQVDENIVKPCLCPHDNIDKIFVTMLITYSILKILVILNQNFFKPILRIFFCKTSVSIKLLFFWAAFLLFALIFWPLDLQKFCIHSCNMKKYEIFVV